MKLKSLNRRKRDARGREIAYLVPDMLKYVSESYKPLVQYCISHDPDIRYSVRRSSDDESLPVMSIHELIQAAQKDTTLYESPAMDRTYHAWEKQNSEYRSFSSEVVRMVGERFTKPSDFYRAAGIDKRTFHKIRSDYGYQPSRDTALRCCIGLRLNVEEAEALLKLAGLAFSPNNPNDLVVRFCLEKGIHDIPGVNYMLYRYATRTLADNRKG